MRGRRRAPDGDEPTDPATLSAIPAHAIEASAALPAWPEDCRAICIAADDFGLHSGVNRAVLRLVALGRVHAIGCLVGGKAWRSWSRLLNGLDANRIDVGLHLDLTETPLLSHSIRPLSVWLRDSFLRRLDARAVRAEIRAQLDAFEQSVGRAPAYADGHRHVHQLPVVRDELLAELERRYGPVRPWVRSTHSRRAPFGFAPGHWGDHAKPWGIERVGASGLASLARRMGYPQNACLWGVYDFGARTRRYADLMAAWLHVVREGDLMMSHPSLPTHEHDPLIRARCAEFRVLAGAAFAGELAEAGITLRPMSKILARRSSG